MKIRRIWLIQWLCMLGYWFLRALLATVHCKYWRSGADFRPSVQDTSTHYVYAFWHEYLLIPMVGFSHSSVRILASQHADGTIVGEISKHLRMGLVQGSTTRGGVEALRKLLRPGRFRHVGVTPDGPRGPRRKLQLGIIYLAARLGWPIVAVGVGVDRPWRLRSWDRFCIPRPFHRATVVTMDAIAVPPNLDREGWELYRRKVEDALNSATALAERAADTARKPRFDVPATESSSDTLAA